MKFALTMSEENLNTIITTLRNEQTRAIENNDDEAKTSIKHALDAINRSVYVVNDVKKRR